MLEQQNIDWDKLTHAYGSAGNIPALIAQLEEFPDGSKYDNEPYFTLWSSLGHQGDIYNASLAAFPFLVQHCAKHPEKAHWSILQLSINIEIERLKSPDSVEFPIGTKENYFAAKSQLPKIIGAMMTTNPSDDLTIIGMSGLAIMRNHGNWAEAIQELTPEIAPKFLKKFFDGGFDA